MGACRTEGGMEMSDQHEDQAVNLDSSTSLEFDRRIVVQEAVDASDDVDVCRPRPDRHYCGTAQREILQQPF